MRHNNLFGANIQRLSYIWYSAWDSSVRSGIRTGNGSSQTDPEFSVAIPPTTSVLPVFLMANDEFSTQSPFDTSILLPSPTPKRLNHSETENPSTWLLANHTRKNATWKQWQRRAAIIQLFVKMLNLQCSIAGNRFRVHAGHVQYCFSYSQNRSIIILTD